MKRKTSTILLIVTFLVILACSIIFGTVVTCVNRQKPLVILDKSLKMAIQQGVAENYDYFVKKGLGTHKYDSENPRFIAESIIYIVDESLGDKYRIDFWYCKYLLRSQKEGMCEIDNVSTMNFEAFIDREYWRSFYNIEDKINFYYVNTFAHNDARSDLYFNYYLVITASQKTIKDMSTLW